VCGVATGPKARSRCDLADRSLSERRWHAAEILPAHDIEGQFSAWKRLLFGVRATNDTMIPKDATPLLRSMDSWALCPQRDTSTPSERRREGPPRVTLPPSYRDPNELLLASVIPAPPQPFGTRAWGAVERATQVTLDWLSTVAPVRSLIAALAAGILSAALYRSFGKEGESQTAPPAAELPLNATEPAPVDTPARVAPPSASQPLSDPTAVLASGPPREPSSPPFDDSLHTDKAPKAKPKAVSARKKAKAANAQRASKRARARRAANRRNPLPRS
jgi:hypothetical protein